MLPPRLRLLWEVPLAVPSYLSFVGLRALLYGMARFSGGRPQRWRLFDAETIERMLPIAMLIGPRWNTHALIINSAAMLRVERRITVRPPDPAQVSWWSAVVRDRRRRAHHHIGTVGLEPGQHAIELDVPPGIYSVAFRYYDFAPGAPTPEIAVDGVTALPAAALPSSATLDAYEAVRGRSGLFYRAIASHVYPMLCLRRWLPDGFVHRTFLPVGDPTNAFAFGVVERGARLRIEAPPEWLDRYRVVFTAYNRSSFPVHWSRIEAATVETPPMPCQGFWLVRVHALAAGTPPAPIDDIRVVELPAE